MTLYSVIVRQVIALLNDIAGETASDMGTKYNLSTLAAADLRTPYWSIPEIHDAILATQSDLVHVICNTLNSPHRALFASRTAPLASGATLPSVDKDDVPILGALGSIRDWDDDEEEAGRRCMPKDIPEIERINNNAAHTANQHYYAAMDGFTIYHTRALVVIDCCAYQRDGLAALVASANGEISLPDTLENALVCGSVWRLANKQGMYADMAAPMGQYYSGIVNQLQNGAANVPGFTMPVRKAE